MGARQIVVAAVAALGLAGCGAGARPPQLLPRSWREVSAGRDGGTMWAGVIPHPHVRDAVRESVVYLPPHASRTRRYPVVYLLHGFRGSPFGYVNALRFADLADRTIADGRIAPFVAVMPAAGPNVRYNGEWAGRWERFVVRDVVPWVDRVLPVRATAQARAIGGDSAGGYGGLDIGLRHPRMFRTLESWSGYFTPIADGPLKNAPPARLRANDPSILIRRAHGVRIFLSVGTRDRTAYRDTLRFAREIAGLRVPHRLVVVRGGKHDARFWRAQLPDALSYALAPAG